MKIEEAAEGELKEKEYMAAIQEFKAKFGLDAWETLQELFGRVTWRLKEALKAARESRNMWKSKHKELKGGENK